MYFFEKVFQDYLNNPIGGYIRQWMVNHKFSLYLRWSNRNNKAVSIFLGALIFLLGAYLTVYDSILHRNLISNFVVIVQNGGVYSVLIVLGLLILFLLPVWSFLAYVYYFVKRLVQHD
jgi:hypothetical protein